MGRGLVDERRTIDRRQGERRQKNGPKIQCRACQGWISAVLPDGRFGHAMEQGQGVYRRMRQCQDCKRCFTSVESFERMMPEKDAPA